jgi:glycogen synthase
LTLNQKIAFVTYETPFAPGGGISAVMAHLPHALQRATQENIFVITPFHFNLPKTAAAQPGMNPIGEFTVPFDGSHIPVDLLVLQQDVSWIFIKPRMPRSDQKPFFAGRKHPYDLHQEHTGGASDLLRDSLFFGKAISQALPLIDPASAWILLLQDWEAAPTTFAITNPSSVKTPVDLFLTLHNTYDHGISSDDFEKVALDPADFPGNTVLECALPLLKDPILTVSEQFARDFSSEWLISNILMPHLSSKISPRLVGLNNGIFKDLVVPEKVVRPTASNDTQQFFAWKSANRISASLALDKLADSPETPIWGDLKQFRREDLPWFVLAGRDDPRQKGYEIACMAADKFLSEGGEASFLFFPIPGDEGLAGISFIHDLADKFPASVLCLPFLIREGFLAVMQGSSYGIMPSYYEPFGMANEFYLSGVVCIGRATGGILQQVVPYREVGSFSPAVRRRSDYLHGSTNPPTGLLFREEDAIPTAHEDWLAFDQAGYELGAANDRLTQRRQLPLFRSMAVELADCIDDAVQIYARDPEIYYQLLVNGIAYIQQGFNWELTAMKYSRIIQAPG